MAMTPVEVLELALKKEKQAAEMYQELADEHPAISKLLLNLKNEEEKHKKLIEDKLVEIRLG